MLRWIWWSMLIFETDPHIPCRVIFYVLIHYFVCLFIESSELSILTMELAFVLNDFWLLKINFGNKIFSSFDKNVSGENGQSRRCLCWEIWFLFPAWLPGRMFAFSLVHSLGKASVHLTSVIQTNHKGRCRRHQEKNGISSRYDVSCNWSTSIVIPTPCDVLVGWSTCGHPQTYVGICPFITQHSTGTEYQSLQSVSRWGIRCRQWLCRRSAAFSEISPDLSKV